MQPITEATIATYRNQGYLIQRDFLGPSELHELRVELDRYIGEIVPTLADRDAFYVDRSRPETLKQMQHMGHAPFFAAYPRRNSWMTLAAALVGEPVRGEAPEWFNKPPGTDSPTPPHQDNYYFCLRPPQVVTLWLALDPVERENGCLHYVPGSHREGIRPHAASQVLGFSQGICDYGEADRQREVAIELAPGDLVVHHGELIHRADPNRTRDRQRRAFAIVYKGESCERDSEAFRRYQNALQAQHERLGLQT
ncbi:MAG: phytanoyl-CoA dioxygenase family protein [Armatimonadetes bacterium]|nr:phytanoyl-CoA dioxygenase family protein [Armatimonadota bacterium]